ncbi:hypothetical protein [Sediminimonas sp.]|uniref:hypothetical protein n=1 Tax=Sediminimonas sp. TaxID=2823379 RepID=UPI0025F10117|nr:hypothetical protein [Sediminimonas sp.]
MSVCVRPLASSLHAAARRDDAAAWCELLALAPAAGLLSESWLDTLLDRIEARR